VCNKMSITLNMQITMSNKQRSHGRDCTSSAILTGWVTLSLYFRLKGYVSRQYL